MKNLIILVLTSSLLILSGCASMIDSMNKAAGLGVLSVDKATFDDSTTVKMSPNWLYEPPLVS